MLRSGSRRSSMGRSVVRSWEEKAGLALAADGSREERHERDERDVLHPEGGAGAVDEVLEVGVAGAEVEGPRRRIVLAGGEHAALDLVDALAQPVHALAADAV